MEFRLTYEGQLLGASRNNTRALHKHEIRKAFHPQLRKVWKATPWFESLRDPLPDYVISINRPPDRSRLEVLPERFKCGQFNLVPLVTRDLDLKCGLEILFLRPDYPGGIVRSGDIDNRLKTLFDALRIPGPDAELGGATPQRDENPLFCLLEDDSLITRVSVETDLLLAPIAGDVNDARIVISVSIVPAIFSWSNIGFV